MIGVFVLDDLYPMDSKYVMKSYDLEHGISGEWKTISSRSMSEETSVSKYVVNSPYKLRISYFGYNFPAKFFGYDIFFAF